ncbi:hypothetical protein BH18VER2_BH18VER2_04890 [soil metagenome]
MNSVEIKSVDLGCVRASADKYARQLFAQHPQVEEVVVFGSFADDTYAPGSDLDVFIVLGSAERPVRDRIAAFLPGTFPVPVDIFPFTRAEMAGLSPSPLLEAVRRSDWRYRR